MNSIEQRDQVKNTINNNFMSLEKFGNRVKVVLFDERKSLPLNELESFLEKQKPFNCCDVFGLDTFEYGDYDNFVSVVLESRTISPRFTRTLDSGKIRVNVRDSFWQINPNSETAPWERRPTTGYSIVDKPVEKLEDVTVSIVGFVVVPW